MIFHTIYIKYGVRALLINPWIYDFKAFDFWNKPLGLLIVARLLKEAGFKVELIDCLDRRSPYFQTNTRTDDYGRGKYYYEVVDKPKLYKNIARYYKRYGIPKKIFVEVINRLDEPDIIFVTSSMTYWYPGVFEVIRLIKEKFPRRKVILGGIYATLCKTHAEKYSGADIVFTGPAEQGLLELLSNLDYPVSTKSTAWLLPDFSLYNKLDYGVILTSRGCPFHCTYCATNFLFPEFKSFPEQQIFEQLIFFNQRCSNIAFFDDALLYNKNFTLLLKKIIAGNYNLKFHTSNGLHCRYINKELAELMLKANFKTIYLSLETTNPEVQKRTGGKVSTREFLKAVKLLKTVGFPADAIHTYILYGIPGQDYQEAIASINLCHQLGIHPHLCEFSPIPFTEEYKKTGFDEHTDPLFHNNLFYAWFYPEYKNELYQRIKGLLTQSPTSQDPG